LEKGDIMQEIGMQFSAKSIADIVAGRKTQTRRPMNPQPTTFLVFMGEQIPMTTHQPIETGDRIWIKEKWLVRGFSLAAAVGDDKPERAFVVFEDKTEKWIEYPKIKGGTARNPVMWGDWITHQAITYGGYNDLTRDVSHYPLRPARYMPKWMARTWLEVTHVRKQRIRSISVQDAHCEGYPSPLAFLTAFEELNAKRGYYLRDNPWVYAYTFRLLNPEERIPAAAS
jgi:hypothetical protein